MCGWQPNVDVVIDESSRTLVVRAELAGADSESLRVFLDGQRLFVSGRRAKTARLRGGSFVQKGDRGRRVHEKHPFAGCDRASGDYGFL